MATSKPISSKSTPQAEKATVNKIVKLTRIIQGVGWESGREAAAFLEGFRDLAFARSQAYQNTCFRDPLSD